MMADDQDAPDGLGAGLRQADDDVAVALAGSRARRRRLTCPSHGKSGDDHDFVTEDFSTVSCREFVMDEIVQS
jgi:hypothetical protein